MYLVTVIKASGDPKRCHTRLYDTKSAAKEAYVRMHNMGFCVTFSCALLPDEISGFGDDDEAKYERRLDDTQFAQLWGCPPSGLSCVQRYRASTTSAASSSLDG